MNLEPTNLYYLGGLPGSAGEQYITAHQSAFLVPPVGEFIRVPRHVAEDVIRRNPGAFTLHAREAQRVTNVQQNYRPPQDSKQLSVAELEAMLAEARMREAVETAATPRSKSKAKKSDGVVEIKAAESEIDLNEIQADLEKMD